MKFLMDECCNHGIVKKLRENNYDVRYIQEESSGISDSAVLEQANRENRILVTEDKDFGELVYRLNKKVPGIILLRFVGDDRDLKWPRLEQLISEKTNKLMGHFVVVDAEKARIRQLRY